MSRPDAGRFPATLLYLAPAAGLLVGAAGLGMSSEWVLTSRLAESEARRRAWPARGFYADSHPPERILAVRSRTLVLMTAEDAGTLVSGGLWFVPFRQGRSAGEGSICEPPPEIADAALRGWRAMGLTAGSVLLLPDEKPARVWETQYRGIITAPGTAGARLATQAGMGSRLRRAVARDGYLVVNGGPVTFGARVEAGDDMLVLTPASAGGRLSPTLGPLAIRYEDEHLLVVDKPAGVLVHPARGPAEGTLANLVVAHLGALGISPVARAVGRLDRGTSGLVLFAKTQYAHAALSRLRQTGRLRRTYIALTGSGPFARGQELVLRSEVVSPASDPSRYRVPRPAASNARILRVYPGGCALQVEPLTGRTHQIRQQLAVAGLPLLGDPAYGGDPAGLGRTALHCWRLKFPHPVGGQPLSVAAPLPSDLLHLLAHLRQGRDDQ